MLKLRRANNDNVSIAYTKSSKTLKSKINNNPEIEVKRFEPPYFKGDPIIKEIEQRAKRESNKTKGLYTKPKEVHLKTAGKILDQLFRKHEKTKQRLAKLKEEAQKRLEDQCPFRPIKQGVQKFPMPGGDVVRRNQIWLQQKIKREFSMKEESILEDLNACTFTPTIYSRKKNEQYLRNRSTSPQAGRQISRSRRKGLTIAIKNSGDKSETSSVSKANISKGDFQRGIRQINNRIYTMY